MPDREKVIKGLERCLICDISVVASEESQNAYLECEYTVGLYCGQKKLLYDALTLLKEQEAVEPKISESYRTNSGRMSRRKAWCGACGIGINFDAKFCDHCGQAVKWE